MDPRAPVIVGVGQVTNRRERIVDPMELMEAASRLAIADAGGSAVTRIRSVQVVNVIAHSFTDPAGILAERLGLADGERVYTTVGGNTPQWLLARACDQIARGEVDAILIAGSEAQDSIRQAQAQGQPVQRGPRGAPVGGTVVGETRQAMGRAEAAARLNAPINVYPLFESALAHQSDRTPAEQRAWLGRFMAPFTKVAASHPDTAWFPQERTPEQISTVTPDNRLIGEPYTKMLNAIMQVDMGAALVLMSAEAAEAAGVPRDRWVFPWSSADLTDVFVTAERPYMHRSPAIETAGARALEAAGIGIDDVSSFDFYSCFPCAVQLGAQSLGVELDDPRGLTMTGGLPYFGGPGNNYVTHSIAYTAERCRAEPESIGVVTGLGWYVTKHAVGVYSATPPEHGWRHADTKADQERIDAEALIVADDASGTATVEAFTVQHDRNGPVTAPLFGRLADGRRVVASAAEPGLPAELSGRSLVGERVNVRRGESGMVYEPA